MTEAKWNACTEPRQMLQALRRKASDRKLRLFACACCRRSFHRMSDKRSRQAVEVAERFADGLAGPLELAAAWFDADAAKGPRGAAWYAHVAAWHTAWAGAGAARARRAAWDHTRAAVKSTALAAAWNAVPGADRDATLVPAWEAARSAEQRTQTALVRDIFGNPFRPLRPPDAAWLAWNDGTVRRLAAAIYAERRFGDLPVLADALEEAGCNNADMLQHCREQGSVHVPGCWLLDVLLGKS
jgi:hypothetical protein